MATMVIKRDDTIRLFLLVMQIAAFLLSSPTFHQQTPSDEVIMCNAAVFHSIRCKIKLKIAMKDAHSSFEKKLKGVIMEVYVFQFEFN